MNDQDLDEQDVAAWLRAMPPRPEPSGLASERARATARQRWHELLKNRRQSMPRPARTWAFAAIAGCAALAAVATLVWMRDAQVPATGVAFGWVEHIEGGARLAAEGVPERPLAAGAPLMTGTRLSTDDGRLAVAVPGGLSLRVDRYSIVRFDRPGQATLVAGSLYVDSGTIAGPGHLRIVSPAGTIEHVGTQYQATVRGESTMLAVREGAVRLQPARGSRQAADLIVPAGQQLELSPGQPAVWTPVTPFDARWAWTAKAGPVLEIEGRSVSAFLDWICREQGWRWEIRGALTRAEIDRILLHGSIAGLDADGSLALVSAVADVGFKLEPTTGTLTVSAAAAAAASGQP